MFVLAYLRQNLTNYVCTQLSCLTNSFIRVLGSLVCIIVTFYLLSLVLCCDIYRSTLISIMYPACMITVHGRKSRALHTTNGLLWFRGGGYMIVGTLSNIVSSLSALEANTTWNERNLST